jgi:hypothetical protein
MPREPPRVLDALAAHLVHSPVQVPRSRPWIHLGQVEDPRPQRVIRHRAGPPERRTPAVVTLRLFVEQVELTVTETGQWRSPSVSPEDRAEAGTGDQSRRAEGERDVVQSLVSAKPPADRLDRARAGRPDGVYLENKTRIFFLDGDDEVHRYERAFDHIAGMALPVEDSREVLGAALARS